MNKDIQAGRNCTVKIRPESPAAIEFGEEITGCIKGRDVIGNIASNGSMNTLYEGNVNHLNVIVVEDNNGIDWKIPEADVEKIVCK